MAVNNFLEFDSNQLNIQSDTEYAAESQRINGVGGIAKASIHNKLFRQTSIMAAAIGEIIKAAGYDASDDDITALVTAISNSFAQKPYVDTQLAQIRYYATPEFYGAKGDGVTDDTIALQNAIASGLPVQLKTGTYLISDTLVNPFQMYGSGARKSYIKMTNNTKPIILYPDGGTGVKLNGLSLMYSDWSAGSAETAIAIKLNAGSIMGQSVFSEMFIENCYNAIDGAGEFYSCTFRDLWLDHFENAGMYLHGAGSTGCVFSNIYVTNWENYGTKLRNSAQYGIFLQNYTESILQQINVEHGVYNYGIYFNGCENMKVESVHFEGYIPRSDYSGMINAISARAKIVVDTMVVIFSGSKADGYTAGITSSKHWSLIGVYDNANIEVKNIVTRDNGSAFVEGTPWVAYSNGVGVQHLKIENLYDEDSMFTGTLGFLENSRIPAIERIASKIYYEKFGDGNWSYVKI